MNLTQKRFVRTKSYQMPTKCFFFRAGSNDLDYSPGADYDMDLGENIAREDGVDGEENMNMMEVRDGMEEDAEDMDRMDVKYDPERDYQEVTTMSDIVRVIDHLRLCSFIYYTMTVKRIFFLTAAFLSRIFFTNNLMISLNFL